MRTESQETADISTLNVPKTWQDVYELHLALTGKFANERTAVLSAKEESDDFTKLESTLMQASWKHIGQESATKVLPDDMQNTARELLALLGVRSTDDEPKQKSPGTFERISGTVAALRERVFGMRKGAY